MTTSRLEVLAFCAVGAVVASGGIGCSKPPPPPQPDAGPAPDAGPGTGFLSVGISAPTGLSANITVTGPNGFSRTLTQSTVLTVPPGSYSITAGNILENTPATTPTQYTPTIAGSPALVSTQGAAQVVVGYNFVEGSGKIWITGCDETNGPETSALFGFVPFGPEPEFFVDYSQTGGCLEAMALDAEGSIGSSTIASSRF